MLNGPGRDGGIDPISDIKLTINLWSSLSYLLVYKLLSVNCEMQSGIKIKKKTIGQ